MKRTTKIAALLIALILCLACLSACGAFADDGGFNFRLSEDGEGYICVGIDDDSATSAVIPSIYQNKPVTSIGVSAFRDCSALTSVTIPDSVKIIDGAAFSNCSALTSVTIPDGVANIADQVFENCESLTSIAIPGTVTSIGYNAFSGCSALTDVSIPNSVTSIGDGAFDGCTSLRYNEHNNGKYLGNSGNPHLLLCGVIDTEASAFAISSDTKLISYYAFDNCAFDMRINYSGTKAQWENIYWEYNYGKYTIHCSDGEVTK